MFRYVMQAPLSPTKIMKQFLPVHLTLLASALALAPALAQNAPTPPAPPINPGAPADEPTEEDQFKTPEERRNYALGIFLANQLRRQPTADKADLDQVEAGFKAGLAGTTTSDFISGASLAAMLKQDELKVDPEQLMAALREIMAGGKPRLSETGIRNEMQLVQQEVMQRRQEKTKLEGEANLKAAGEFLEKNAKAEGVVTTPSGLQYKKISDGKGEKANPEEMVMVNFVASIAEGKEFDKTQPGKPRSMPQTRPKGWQEAMQIMDIGSKYQFWIPPALGFGEMGKPPQIKPNVVLVYEVELVGTAPAPPPRPQNPGASTPPVAIPGGVPGVTPVKRNPISATTPPVSIDIPQKPATEKPATEKPKGAQK